MKKHVLLVLTVYCIFTFLTACGENNPSSKNSTIETTATNTTTIITQSSITRQTETEAATKDIGNETEVVTEEATDHAKHIETAEEYAKQIGESLGVNEYSKKAAEMIGAIDGVGFIFNGEKYELYRFSTGAKELESAASGELTYVIDPFGEFTSKAEVNGDFVLLYDVKSDKVSAAFATVDVE